MTSNTDYCVSLFFFKAPHSICVIHSFPTRRSSDLGIGGEKRDLDDPDRLLNRRPGRAWPGRRLRRRSGSSDRKSTRLNSSHPSISYAVFCLKKKKNKYKRE